MKRFIALFLVFSILTLSMPLTANWKKGADLIIQKTDGQQVRGKLIAVKKTSLLLLERDSGADVTVDIDDIRIITIVKKSKFLKDTGFGFLIGTAIGSGVSIIYSLGGTKEQGSSGFDAYGAVFIFAIIGTAIGGIFSVVSGNKTIRIEGKSDLEIQKILEKLRKKAMVSNSQ